MRADLDRLITTKKILAGSMDLKFIEKVQSAAEQGVIGWMVQSENYSIVYADYLQKTSVCDLPIAVAVIAWQNKWIEIDQLGIVFARNKQFLKPGDEGIASDDDGHYYAFCWCNWKSERLYLSPDDAGLRLLKHIHKH